MLKGIGGIVIKSVDQMASKEMGVGGRSGWRQLFWVIVQMATSMVSIVLSDL